MNKNWTFGQKLTAGYVVMLVFVLVTSLVAIYALRTVVASKDQVISTNAQVLIEAEKLRTIAEKRVAAVRGYVLLQDDRLLAQFRATHEEFAAILARLKPMVGSDEARRLLEAVDRASTEHRQSADQVIMMAREHTKQDVLVRFFDDKVLPAREQFDEHLRALVTLEERHLSDAKQAATNAASNAVTLVLVIAAVMTVFAVFVAVLLARTLNRQIGAAVGHVQSSSAELQAAATQQASGAKEQAGAMNEISTTISELGVTSRQIAESAQRVAQIADQTASSARSGESTVDKGQESIAGIRRQIDLVVSHMLDLGRKSQEIGAVLDIVSELAEQTNILAINATIEASGAGEAGKRFAVVAEEIRKLADRVANSTKGIRVQIEDVRGAVNTTVMATENGAKAVDAGTRQFSDVAAAFKQIAGLVATTTDAAREIELSTKQQATAAEQVRIAVTDVAQATQESETSSTQTLQTASQLAGLSMDLRRLIQANAV